MWYKAILVEYLLARELSHGLGGGEAPEPVVSPEHLIGIDNAERDSGDAVMVLWLDERDQRWMDV